MADDYYHLLSSSQFRWRNLFKPTGDQRPIPDRTALCGAKPIHAIYVFDHDTGSRHIAGRPLCPHCKSIADSRSAGIYRTDGRLGDASPDDDAFLRNFKSWADENP